MATIANSLLSMISYRPITFKRARVISCHGLSGKMGIRCGEEYDKELQFSKEKLVIAHFSATHDTQGSRIEQFMEEQIRASRNDDVRFINVITNQSEETLQLCRKENIDKIPSFAFYIKAKKIHQVAGFQPETLAKDIMYYRGDDHLSPVIRLHSREDFERLMRKDHKLIVLSVGTNWCPPCAKIYPSVLTLASQMVGEVVYARANADENDWCMEILRGIGVCRVPAFLFFEKGELCGRYVGSNASALIRKIVKLRTEHRQRDLSNNLIKQYNF